MHLATSIDPVTKRITAIALIAVDYIDEKNLSQMVEAFLAEGVGFCSPGRVLFVMHVNPDSPVRDRDGNEIQP